MWKAVDTPAWLGRDLQLFPNVLNVLRPTGSEPRLSKTSSFDILYPVDFMPEGNPEQVEAMEVFINDMVESSGCSYRKISIREDWHKTAPVEEKDLREYLYQVGFYFE